MELSSTLVGMHLKPYAVTVRWRQMMNYAAAIQDDNPAYFDDRDKNSLIGHPMLPVALTWPLLQNLPEHMASDSFPREILPTQVHYSECLLLFQPIKAGTRITIKGTIAAILPHRSGTQLVIQLDAVDDLGGPVFREYAGALLRGVHCRDGGGGMETLPVTPEHSPLDEPLWERRVFIHPLQTYVYDGCTNIFFPIHTSPTFARDVGLPGIILQGTATLAYAVRELINEEASREPLRLKGVSCRFSHMVLPGTEICVRLTCMVPKGREKALHFVVLNHRDQEAISNGYALMESKDPLFSEAQATGS